MNKSIRKRICSITLLAVLTGSASTVPGEEKCKESNPPEPVVNHFPEDAGVDEKIEHGELILVPNEAAKQLNAQHHSHQVLETRRVPGPFTKPSMKEINDFALSRRELDVINPGPGEYVHVMEGQRHGYRNLTVGITYTAPGGAPPMHTHDGEESHVLLKEQKILYALDDDIFIKEGPYIVNIPPGVPHSFQNLDDNVAELVVIFPTNVWEYHVLNHFPFNTPEARALAREAKEKSGDSR